jgi:carboxypeptidase Q
MTRPIPALFSLALAASLQAQMPPVQAPPPSPVPVLLSYPDTPAGKLLQEVKDHAAVVANVEYLADVIGPRLTGSEQLRQAQRWAMETLKTYGAVNVHEEPYEFGLAWTRGVDSARLLTHNGIRLRVDQVA